MATLGGGVAPGLLWVLVVGVAVAVAVAVAGMFTKAVLVDVPASVEVTVDVIVYAPAVLPAVKLNVFVTTLFPSTVTDE